VGGTGLPRARADSRDVMLSGVRPKGEGVDVGSSGALTLSGAAVFPRPDTLAIQRTA
jgi:hypothetical protein